MFFSVETATPEQQEENLVAEGELPILDEFDNDVALAKEKQAASIEEPREAFLKTSTSQEKIQNVQDTANQSPMLPKDPCNGSVENCSGEIKPECKYLEIYVSKDLKDAKEASEEDKLLGNESENTEVRNCDTLDSSKKTFEDNDKNVLQISESLQTFIWQKLDNMKPQSFELKSQKATELSKRVESVSQNDLAEEKTVKSVEKHSKESNLENLMPKPKENNKKLLEIHRGFSEASFISDTIEDSALEVSEEAAADGEVTLNEVSEPSKIEASEAFDEQDSDVVTKKWVVDILSTKKNEEDKVFLEAPAKDDSIKIAAAGVKKLEDLPSFSEPFLSDLNKLEDEVAKMQNEGDGWTYKTEKPTPALEKSDQASELGKKNDSLKLGDLFKDLKVKLLADSTTGEIEDFDVKLLENRSGKVSYQLDSDEPSPALLQSFSSFLMRSCGGERVIVKHQEVEERKRSEALVNSEAEEELAKTEKIDDLFDETFATNEKTLVEEPQPSEGKTGWILPSYSYKDMMQVNSDDDELYDDWSAPRKRDIALANGTNGELEKFDPRYIQHLESNEDGRVKFVGSKFCRHLK